MDQKKITRRDFVSGLAIAAGAIGVSPMKAIARGALAPEAIGQETYPSDLTGIRGSNDAAIQFIQQLEWGAERFSRPEAQTDDTYDLVVVGAGLSGLAAAWFYRQKASPDAKILILDNHDDFGGHARRNEFEVNGKTVLMSGGSFLMSHPEGYPDEIKELLHGIGIELQRFEEFHDAGFFERNGLSDGVFFPGSSFGDDILTGNVLSMLHTTQRTFEEREAFIDQYPLSGVSKAAFKRLIAGEFEFMPDASTEERDAVLADMPARDFIADVLGFEEDGLLFFQNLSKALGAYGIDVLSAREVMQIGLIDREKGYALMQTVQGNAFDGVDMGLIGNVVHHFPDGNAGVARMLVRNLIPGSAPGTTMDDVVTARFAHSKLDLPENNVRLRLSSPVVDMRNVGDDAVDVTYTSTRDGSLSRVQARHVVMAGYNGLIPLICPGTPRHQAEALSRGEKVPMCYVNLALNNWRPIKESGFARIYSLDSFFCNIWMDYAVNMGDYKFASTPDDPVALILHYMPSASDAYESPIKQAREGRRRLLDLSLEEIEEEARKYLTDVWGPHGFNYDRDVEAITVNRWLYGYAPQYHDRWSAGIEREGEKAPHVIGRQKIGRISIANTDSQAHAFLDAAMMAASRAVNEQLG